MSLAMAQPARAISIGSLDIELGLGSSTLPHDGYAWPADGGGQSGNLTVDGQSLGGRNYTGYSDPFIYYASGTIGLTTPPDQYTIDIRVWTDGSALLPPGVLGSDGSPLDRITLHIGGQGWGDRDGLPDLLSPDLVPSDDRFRILTGSFRSFRTTSTSPGGGNLLQVFTIPTGVDFVDGWAGSQTFNAANAKMLLLRLTVQHIPEPGSLAMLVLGMLATHVRRPRRIR